MLVTERVPRHRFAPAIMQSMQFSERGGGSGPLRIPQFRLLFELEYSHKTKKGRHTLSFFEAVPSLWI